MPRKAPTAPAPALDEPHELDEPDEQPRDSTDDELSAVLDEIGGADGLVLSIWRTRPRRGFVTKLDAGVFDVAEFARTYGGGEYEIRVYRAGSPGLVRRVALPIDDTIKPAAPQLAGMREERSDDTRELMRMMFAQAVESQKAQAQILTALIARPAPAIDPAIMALLVERSHRSSAGELAELLAVTQKISGGGGGTDWASVVKAGLEFAAVAAKAPPPAPAPPRTSPPRPALQHGKPPASAILTSSPAEAGARGGVPNPPTTPQDDAQIPGNCVSGQGGALGTQTDGEQASGEAMGKLLGAFSAYPHDPAPTATEYARKVVDAVGEERVTDAIDTTKSGELAAQLAGFVSGVPLEFLRDVETTLRAWFEEDAQ